MPHALAGEDAALSGRTYAKIGLLWLAVLLLLTLVRGGLDAWWVLALALAFVLLPAAAYATVVNEPPYEPPAGSSVLLTMQRHDDWPRVLVRLQLAGIDAQLVEEPHKSFGRRMGHALCVDRISRPFGPWHVVVPTPSLEKARQVIGKPDVDRIEREARPA